MQAEYKKEWMDTYLWVLPEQKAEDTFVEQMLLHNQGEGRLEFSKQEKDGEEYFCYKVTGKKALNSIYAVVPIRERQIRRLLGQVFSALENGREYLLCEEDFVLSPNYIFATFPQMDMELCYVPGYGVPLREQLEGLFEYLLNRVDYEDKQAVNLLYDCYMFCMKEQGGLAEIKKMFEKESEPELPSQPMPPRVLYPEADVQEKKEASVPYVSRWTDRFFHRRRKEMLLVAEEPEPYGVKPAEASRPKPEAEENERTVLLSHVKKRSQPELLCEQTGEVILLDKFPFYMGCAEEYVDYVLTGEGVSRIHCCIDKKEDNYYLSDLNSTNGTYLNKKEVLPGKNILLSANDEFRVAGYDFYVKFPCH